MELAFVAGLRELGYTVTDLGGGRISFPYTISVGKFEGEKITLGFVVNDQFPAVPPGGPHLSPPLLPIHEQNDIPHPLGGVHKSDFGPEWQYWSRPYPEWHKSGRTVRDFMTHIQTLFQTQ